MMENESFAIVLAPSLDGVEIFNEEGPGQIH